MNLLSVRNVCVNANDSIKVATRKYVTYQLFYISYYTMHLVNEDLLQVRDDNECRKWYSNIHISYSNTCIFEYSNSICATDP